MSTRSEGKGRPERRTETVLARPGELFGESLPELALVTAIVTAVITATLALSG